MLITPYYDGSIKNLNFQNQFASAIEMYHNNGLGENISLIYDQYHNEYHSHRKIVESEILCRSMFLPSFSQIFTFQDGISVIGVYFSFLIQQELLYTNRENFLLEINLLIARQVVKPFENKDHDFNITGNTVYLILRSSFPNADEYFFKIMADNSTFYWSERGDNAEVINLSFTNGQESNKCSIIE